MSARHSVRVASLKKSPGFTATALLSLAVGIGGATGLFSVVYAVLLNPFPEQTPLSGRRATQVAQLAPGVVGGAMSGSVPVARRCFELATKSSLMLSFR